MSRIGIIGTGVVGSAVAVLLHQQGHVITGVYSRGGQSAERLAAELSCQWYDRPEGVLDNSEIVFLTVPDKALEEMANRLAASGRVRAEQVFYHMSGALPAEVLTALGDAGAVIGSMHPLQAFAGVQQAVLNLPGSFFALQGDPVANEKALGIITDLKGNPFIIKAEDKALYHLGACVASNYLVSLIHFAVNIYLSIGMTREQAITALMPLVKGTLANIEALGPAKALTGPVARGDLLTVARHLEAVSCLPEHLKELYEGLGRYTIRVAMEKLSITQQDADKFSAMFEGGR